MTARDQTFLYCYLIYGQQQEIFDALPAERTEMLKKQLKKYDRFPREVRLTLVLKLFGYLVRHVRNPYLEMVHPSWIADLLKNAHPTLAGLIVGQFSPDYRKRLSNYLPSLPRSPKSAKHEAPELVLQVVSTQFASMAAPWGDPELTMDALYLLREEDLMLVIQQIGIRELARAFAAAGREAVAALSKRFTGEIRADFLKAAESVANESSEVHKIAAARLKRIDLSSTQLELAVIKAGLATMAAMLKHKSGLKQKIAQRLPKELGVLLIDNQDENDPPQSDDFIQESLHSLVAQGKIDKSFIANRYVSTGDLSKSTKMRGNGKSQEE